VDALKKPAVFQPLMAICLAPLGAKPRRVVGLNGARGAGKSEIVLQ